MEFGKAQLFCFSLTNSTQFVNDSNYSNFTSNGENIATNCFVVTVLGLDSLTKKHFNPRLQIKTKLLLGKNEFATSKSLCF